MSDAVIDRGFVRLGAGLAHYRSAGPDSARTVILAHGGPGSSAGLSPLIASLSLDRKVIAPDMMGMGCSDAPPERPPTIEAYARDLIAVMDALGVAQADLYGDHTGAQVVCEVALAHPERVGCLILDGLALFSPEVRAEFLERYAPPIAPVADGTHLSQVWTFVTELTRHFPWYGSDEACRVTGGRVRPPGILTDQAAEILQVWRTAHLTYRAAFSHPLAARLTQLRVSTTVLAVEGDPLAIYAQDAVDLIPGAVLVATSRAGRPEMLGRLLNSRRG